MYPSYRKSMNVKKTVQQLTVKKEARQQLCVEPNLLPDVQALKKDLIG